MKKNTKKKIELTIHIQLKEKKRDSNWITCGANAKDLCP